MKKKLYLMVALCCGCFFYANAEENLLKDAKWSGIKPKIDGNEKCFEQQGRYTFYRGFIPVDIAMTYNFSGWVKNPTKKELRVLMGIKPYDKDRKRILEHTVIFEPGTDTELVEDCTATDTIIKVKDAFKWKTHNKRCKYLIAFKTQKDLSDLPNKNLSSSGIEKIEKKNDYWEITLKKPVKCAFPKGTLVREHKLISPLWYTSIEKVPANSDWIELKGKLFSKWYPGTKYCLPVIIGGTGLLFKDIKLEKVE